MEKHHPYGPYEKYFKRPLDLLCGLAAVIVFFWLYSFNQSFMFLFRNIFYFTEIKISF